MFALYECFIVIVVVKRIYMQGQKQKKVAVCCAVAMEQTRVELSLKTFIVVDEQFTSRLVDRWQQSVNPATSRVFSRI